MKKVLALSFLSLLSGAASAFLINVDGEWGLWVLPGIAFGIAGAIYTFLFMRISSLRTTLSLIWIAASTASYYAAASLAFFTLMWISSFWVAFLFAGLGGGILMLLSWHFLVYNIRARFLFFLVLLAGVLGLIPILFSDPLNQNLPLQTLFVVWQYGMGTALGFAMKYSERKVDSIVTASSICFRRSIVGRICAFLSWSKINIQ